MTEENLTLSEKLPKDHAEVLERLAKENNAVRTKYSRLAAERNALKISNDAWCRSVFARGSVRASYDPAYRFLRQLAWLGLLDKTGKNTAEIMQAAAEEKLDLEHVRHILEEILAPEALEAVPPAGETFTIKLGGKRYMGYLAFDEEADLPSQGLPPAVVYVHGHPVNSPDGGEVFYALGGMSLEHHADIANEIQRRRYCLPSERTQEHADRALAARRNTKTENVCEHGDHAAPLGQRFCSKKCQDCEIADFNPSVKECAGLCSSMEGEMEVSK